jgi:hypothetical protein
MVDSSQSADVQQGLVQKLAWPAASNTLEPTVSWSPQMPVAQSEGPLQWLPSEWFVVKESPSGEPVPPSGEFVSPSGEPALPSDVLAPPSGEPAPHARVPRSQDSPGGHPCTVHA